MFSSVWNKIEQSLSDIGICDRTGLVDASVADPAFSIDVTLNAYNDTVANLRSLKRKRQGGAASVELARVGGGKYIEITRIRVVQQFGVSDARPPRVTMDLDIEAKDRNSKHTFDMGIPFVLQLDAAGTPVSCYRYVSRRKHCMDFGGTFDINTTPNCQ